MNFHSIKLSGDWWLVTVECWLKHNVLFVTHICSNKINIAMKKKNYFIKYVEGKDCQTNVFLMSAPKSSHFPLRKLPLTLHLPCATSHLTYLPRPHKTLERPRAICRDWMAGDWYQYHRPTLFLEHCLSNNNNNALARNASHVGNASNQTSTLAFKRKHIKG